MAPPPALRIVPAIDDAARDPDADDLADRCRLRDPDAWAALYRDLARPLANYLRRVAGPGAETGDLIQEVFTLAIASIDRFRGDARLTTWLYGIATHVAERHGRWEFRTRRRAGAYGDWLAGAAEATSDPAEGMEARVALKVLGEAVAGMAHGHRSVWVMREWEGLSTEEVAQALALPLGTVRSRLFAARRHVLEALRKAGLEGIASPQGADADPLPGRIAGLVGDGRSGCG